jgi:hypothetical protein
MGVLATFATQIQRLTYSTSSRHGGQAKAGMAASLVHTVFCKVERRIATALRFFTGETPASTAVRLMHRKGLTIDRTAARRRRK